MTTYFKLTNHGELGAFWRNRLLAYYKQQPMTWLQFPPAAHAAHGGAKFPVSNLQVGDQIVLFQYICPVAQVVTHVVEVTGACRPSGYPDYPWESPVKVVRQLTPTPLGGVTYPVGANWPGTPNATDGAAGAAPQVAPTGAVRLGELLGLGNVTVPGIRDGCLRHAAVGHTLQLPMIAHRILNSTGYI